MDAQPPARSGDARIAALAERQHGVVARPQLVELASQPVSLDALLTRYPGRRGTAPLRTIVDRGGLGETRTRSDLEPAFLADRARDRDLQSRGYTILRITWRQLHDDAPRIAAQLRSPLSRMATVSVP